MSNCIGRATGKTGTKNETNQKKKKNQTKMAQWSKNIRPISDTTCKDSTLSSCAQWTSMRFPRRLRAERKHCTIHHRINIFEIFIWVVFDVRADVAIIIIIIASIFLSFFLYIILFDCRLICCFANDIRLTMAFRWKNLNHFKLKPNSSENENSVFGIRHHSTFYLFWVKSDGRWLLFFRLYFVVVVVNIP